MEHEKVQKDRCLGHFLLLVTEVSPKPEFGAFLRLMVLTHAGRIINESSNLRFFYSLKGRVLLYIKT